MMDRPRSFEKRSQAIAYVVTIWLLAPAAPPIVALIAQALGASDGLTLNIQDWAAAGVLCVLTPLSIWGAVELEDWLGKTRLSSPALLVLPFAAVCSVGLATQAGRMAAALPGLPDDPMSTYNLMRIGWTVLIAYQLKSVWDHAKAEWRKDRWRALLRGVPRFSRRSRKAVLSRRRKTQATNWRQRLNLGPLATPEQALLDTWLESRANARALRKLRPKPKLGTRLLIIGAGLVIGGLLFHLSR